VSARILLLGAGFSRNWGGWLASEAFEYLLGCPQVDADIRNLLWSHKRKGGFEDALAYLQDQFARRRNPQTEQRLTILQSAIRQMFDDMDKAFAAITHFEPPNHLEYMVASCLVRFDAIFTLNQDLLMERHYLNGYVGLSSYRQWNGWQIPGMKRLSREGLPDPGTTQWCPLPQSEFHVGSNSQPYFKLHGSSNWIDANNGQQLLVMGGDKATTINQHPILKWYHERFKQYLAKPDVRLMVIGYSFGDHHINQAIAEAADRSTLRLFIIDPLGVDVLDKNRNAPIPGPNPLFTRLQPHLVGASRRTVREIFGNDRVEHAKVMKFITSM
jgi:SIR2-like domain